MLQVARLAPSLLRDSTPLVGDFLRSRQNPDGGFQDRAGKSDLYYTVFGLEGLLALREEVPEAVVADYLLSFGGGEGLDLVHLASLARCWAALPAREPGAEIRSRLLFQLETYRTPDGGYHTLPESERGSLYACFLGLGARQDLRSELPEPDRFRDAVVDLARAGQSSRPPGEDEPADAASRTGGPIARVPGGASDRPAPRAERPGGFPTPVLAAAVTLLRYLGQDVDPALARQLLSRRRPGAGFAASASTPVPDLLSTATALHALAGIHVPFDDFKEDALDFVDTLWSSRGGFYGHWADDVLDCEYTYYGLLTLGHLSL